MYGCFIFSLSYSTNRTLSAVELIFDSKVSQSCTCDGKFLSYYIQKRLIYLFFCGFIQFFHGLTQLLLHIENIYHNYFLDLSLLYFLSNQESPPQSTTI